MLMQFGRHQVCVFFNVDYRVDKECQIIEKAHHLETQINMMFLYLIWYNYLFHSGEISDVSSC